MRAKSKMNMMQSSTKQKINWRLCVKRIASFTILSFLVIFILYPIIKLIAISFSNGFEAYISVYNSPIILKALMNTIKMEIIILLGTWLFGGSLAFIRHKTDYKNKKNIDKFVFLAFTVPPYILSISWIVSLSNGGYLSRLFNLFNWTYSFNSYTLFATGLILTMHLYPLVYYGVGNALKKIDYRLIQSGKVCGGNKRMLTFNIIISLTIPAFISTGLLVVSRSMSNFGVPAQLALPSGQEVLTTRLFSAMSDLNIAVVSVISLILIAISIMLFLISEKKLKKSNYITNIEKNDNFVLIKLGKSHSIINIFIKIFFTFSVIIPFITIILSSFFKRWGLKLTFENLTFHNYVRLFAEEKILSSPLINSVTYGVVAGVLAAIVASICVYHFLFVNSKFSKIIMNIAQLPIAIPNMVLAVAAMFAWINPPFKLYGTSLIIIITYTVLFIPICIKQILSTASNLNVSLDLAARTCGIGVISRFTKIFLPLIQDSLLSGVIVCFLISLKEIPISLLLYNAGTKTIGVTLFTIQSNSYGLEMTSTVSVVVITISIIGNILLNKFSKRGNIYE